MRKTNSRFAKVIYSIDGTEDFFFMDKEHYQPLEIFYPENEKDVIKIVKEAIYRKWNIVPRGAGTGLTGGASVTEKNSVVIDLSGMNHLIEVSKDDRYIVVEAGMTGSDIERVCTELGLFFPPSPASYLFSTIGGNISENAGGLKAVKYGVTRDYLMGLNLVDGRGEVLKIGSYTIKDVAGLNLVQLVCGSEGTLGIITRAILRLELIPKFKIAFLFFFSDLKDAFLSIRDVFSKGLTPVSVEIVDDISIKAIKSYSKFDFPDEAKCFVLYEINGFIVENVKHEAELLLNTVKAYSVKVIFDQAFGEVISNEVSKDNKEIDNIWELRKSISPGLYNLGEVKINEDICVPVSKLYEIMKYIKRISIESDIPVALFGHAGDGNLHVNILLKDKKKSTLNKAFLIIEKIFKETIRVRGTISGEHGIGISKREFLRLRYSDKEISRFDEIKSIFDPYGIMNRNKIFLHRLSN